MQRKYLKTKAGFTLIETLVAVMIFTSSVLALIAIVSTSLSTIVNTKQKLVGTYLAQEGIEYIRNMRDSYVIYEKDDIGWTKFKDKISLCITSITPNYCGIDNLEPPRKEKFTFVCDSPSFSLCKLYIKNGNYNTNTPSGVDSGFTRKINIETIPGTDDEIKIISTVEWGSGSATKKISFSENLFNWTKPGVGTTAPPGGGGGGGGGGNIVATGGNKTEDIKVGGINYRVHIFTTPGDFIVTKGGEVEYLVVGGGGGGGGKDAYLPKGGGGAGGFMAGSLDVSTKAYTITVGAGGGASTNGGNSIFGGITAIGGGAGGANVGGANGGSGGGGYGNGSTFSGGAGTAGQGNNGGNSVYYSYWDNSGAGGGGGAGAVGNNAPNATTGGNGGAGLSSSISGSAVTYAGGGGGAGKYSNGSGGSGVGGAGGGGAGVANSGGGGGGGQAYYDGNASGGSGGSGIVIIRYKIP